MSEKEPKGETSESQEKKGRISRFLSFIWNAIKWMFGKND